MLSHAVQTYLEVRRAAGFQLNRVEYYLRDFANWASAHGDTHVVTKTAIGWAAKSTCEAQRHNRLMTVVRFARFMHAEDRLHEVPSKDVFCGRRQRPSPYIFSDNELVRLLTHTRRLGPKDSLRPHTYATLFGLLACTGMRPSEARNLELSDLTTDGLLIRESKFKKSRLLPLHDTATAVLKNYLKRRCRTAGNDPHLFVSRRQRKLSYTVVVDTFHEVLDAAGIPDDPSKPRPRLMDLRHTYAVRVLEACPDSRDEVGRHTLALTTYMGHAKVESTYWYLENTPELMTDIARHVQVLFHGGTQ